ncbi:hypothetical protein BpHYR1_007748 [Brachionus plicatilis]|uniref:Uncharacterized protein n=1 Tax=Brachionus plicatilis TaxID=10195 RepID=A0A3M7RNV3_BRAPC|nr:hypothetical protein BpHYR1_007748 [Brachionus plicatilis]
MVKSAKSNTIFSFLLMLKYNKIKKFIQRKDEADDFLLQDLKFKITFFILLHNLDKSNNLWLNITNNSMDRNSHRFRRIPYENKNKILNKKNLFL